MQAYSEPHPAFRAAVPSGVQLTAWLWWLLRNKHLSVRGPPESPPEEKSQGPMPGCELCSEPLGGTYLLS